MPAGRGGERAPQLSKRSLDISAHPTRARRGGGSKPLAAAGTTMKCSTDKRSAAVPGRRLGHGAADGPLEAVPGLRLRPGDGLRRPAGAAQGRGDARDGVARHAARDGGPGALEGPRAGLGSARGCDKIVPAADVGGFGGAARAAVARPRPRAARLFEEVHPLPPRRRGRSACRSACASATAARGDPARRRVDQGGPRARRLPPRRRGSKGAAVPRHAEEISAPARAGLHGSLL